MGNSYIILKDNKEEAKENTVKLVLPFPHFLWMLGANSNTLHEVPLYELQKEQGKTNQANVDDKELL